MSGRSGHPYPSKGHPTSWNSACFVLQKRAEPAGPPSSDPFRLRRWAAHVAAGAALAPERREAGWCRRGTGDRAKEVGESAGHLQIGTPPVKSNKWTSVWISASFALALAWLGRFIALDTETMRWNNTSEWRRSVGSCNSNWSNWYPF